LICGWSKPVVELSASVINGEVRYALFAKRKEKCYTAIFTLRGAKYRIISVRRCRKQEEKIYEND